MSDWIYLDNNATTKPLPEVAEAVQRVLTTDYANPSSIHQFGQSVRHQVECARAQVSALIGATPREIIFTASGTEAINLAIRGVCGLNPKRRRVVISAVEHSAVHSVGRELARQGYTIDELGVDGAGRIDPDALAERITEETAIVSLLWANNETGALLDAERVAALTHERGAVLHLDAVQAVGKIPIDMGRLPAQLLSMSAHKFHGPKGVGALYVRKRTKLRPLVVGGHQERDLRGGTENVPGIVGMGVAAEAAAKLTDADHCRIVKLRDRLEEGICATIEGARVNVSGEQRLGNTTNIGFKTLQAEAMLLLLSDRGICASSGSACGSGSLEPSPVLLAMNVPQEYAHGSIRFSLSRFTTTDEIERVLAVMPEVVGRLTAISR